MNNELRLKIQFPSLTSRFPGTQSYTWCFSSSELDSTGLEHFHNYSMRSMNNIPLVALLPPAAGHQDGSASPLPHCLGDVNRARPLALNSDLQMVVWPSDAVQRTSCVTQPCV